MSVRVTMGSSTSQNSFTSLPASCVRTKSRTNSLARFSPELSASAPTTAFRVVARVTSSTGKSYGDTNEEYYTYTGMCKHLVLTFKLCLELEENNGFNTDNLHFILLPPEAVIQSPLQL
jgi:hypothetical protein